jgi:uncharacterized phage-associated protein
MSLRYREDKATQAAARLLKLRGGRMSHLKLMKLLYLADRNALVKWGRPITFDWYYSMPHGPVLSFTLNKMTAERDPDDPSCWHTYISEVKDYEVSLLVEDVPNDQLSEAEEGILKQVFEEHGSKSRWELRDFCHRLPEWQDPKGSSLPIPVAAILTAEGFSDTDIRDIMETLDAEEAAHDILG